MLAPNDLFDLQGNRFAELFERAVRAWEALGRLTEFARATVRPNVAWLRKSGDVVQRTVVLHRGEVIDAGFSLEIGDVRNGGLRVMRRGELLEGAAVVQAGAILCSDDIEIGRGSLVEAGALVRGPAIIGSETEVRQGAYVRGNALVGSRCVVGHATEVKSSILLGDTLAGHFAYLGDSILGKVNLGAGTKLANLKLFPGDVEVRIGGERVPTGLPKLGALLGDGVQLGCNSVTMPGTVLGRGTVVYPNVSVRGYHPPGTVVKVTDLRHDGR